MDKEKMQITEEEIEQAQEEIIKEIEEEEKAEDEFLHGNVITLEELIRWRNESLQTRSVDIDLKRMYDTVSIWVYDLRLEEGAFIRTSEDLANLNLEEQKRLSDLRKLEELQKKYNV